MAAFQRSHSSIKSVTVMLLTAKKMLEERGKTVIDGPLEETPGRDGNERKYPLKKGGGE